MSDAIVWVPVAAAALSSVSALGGVMIANWLSAKAKQQERAEVQALAVEDRRRAAGEVLYRVVFGITHTQIVAVKMNLRFLRGQIKPDAYSTKLKETNESLNSLDVAGMRLSVDTYFPEIRDAYAEFSRTIRRCIDFNSEIVSHIGDESLDKGALASKYDSLQGTLEKSGSHICTEIAKLIK